MLSGFQPHYVQVNTGLKSGLGLLAPRKETSDPPEKDSKTAGSLGHSGENRKRRKRTKQTGTPKRQELGGAAH